MTTAYRYITEPGQRTVHTGDDRLGAYEIPSLSLELA
ncbi:hypothetical protein SNOUR_24125 [Streptomyces noursei ATCC 11455]|nr:hypothetical protein SNOUR_24125 [Streptomyces noursei ATCC 11455]